MAFGEEALRRAHHHALLFTGYTEFRQRGCVLFHCPRSHFHKRQRLAVVADEIQFAFDSSRRVVLRDEHISVSPQIPIRIGLAAYASASRFQLFSALSSQPCRIGKALFFAQTTPRCPAHCLKHQSREDRHKFLRGNLISSVNLGQSNSNPAPLLRRGIYNFSSLCTPCSLRPLS